MKTNTASQSGPTVPSVPPAPLVAAPSRPAEAWVGRVAIVAVLLAIVALGGSRLMHLMADPPVRGLGRVAAFYGDQGAWYAGSLWLTEHGELYMPDDYNPVVVVPKMPVVVGVLATVTGMEVWLVARLITALLVLVASAALMIALARRGGAGVALLAGLLLVASYPFFVYSRLALLDAPAVSWVVIGLALLLGWRERRPTWATIAAALAGCIAVLTKSTMLVAMPAYLFAAAMTPNPGQARWRDPLIVAGLGLGVVGGYGLAVYTWFYEDLVLFRAANVSPKSTDPIANAIRFLKSGRVMGEGFCILAAICGPLALWRRRQHPVYPWVVATAVWVLLMSLAVATKGSDVTRYYIPLIPALAIIIAAAVAGGPPRADAAGRVVRAAGFAAALLIAGLGSASIVQYLARPSYTYRDMGADLARRFAELEPGTNWVLYGPWPSGGVALAAGVPALGIRTEPGCEVLEEHTPAYLVTRGPRQTSLTPDELEAVERDFNFGEEITYSVLPGMFDENDPYFHVVRLFPK